MSQGRWFLRKVSQNEHGEQLILLKEGLNLIGRGVENHIKCKSIQVSRKHCSISIENGKVTIQDFKSFNGTFIGDTKVLPMRELELINGDLIGLGAEVSERLCHYVYKLEFKPDISLKDGQNPAVLENLVLPNALVSSKEVEQPKTHCIPLELPKKRSAMSPPPVPMKVARRSVSEEKTIEVNKASLTGVTKSENKAVSGNKGRNNDDDCVEVYSRLCVKIPKDDDKLVLNNSDETSILSLEFVNQKRGTGWRGSDGLVVNTSLMNSSIFSQADDDIIEIMDSDDEFPHSELFETKERFETVQTIKKEEVELEFDENDLAIIEEECSFFEEHFSQNFREMSPPRQDGEAVETGTAVPSDEKESVEPIDEVEGTNSVSIVTEVGADFIKIVPEDSSSTADKLKATHILKDPTPPKDSVDSAQGEVIENDKKNEELEVLAILQDEVAASLLNKIPSVSTKTVAEKTHEDPKKVSRSLLCEALPLPCKQVKKAKGKGSSKTKSRKDKDKQQPEKEIKTGSKQKGLVKERKAKLRELALKEKDTILNNEIKSPNMEGVNASLVKSSKKAPNCNKVTERNRGSFLINNTNLKSLTDGNCENKKLKPKETKKSCTVVEDGKKTKSEDPKTKLTKSSNDVDHTNSRVGMMGRIPKKKSVRFRDKNLVEIREYECEGTLNKIEYKMKDLHLKPSEQAYSPMKNFLKAAPISSFESIYDMCKWNVIWLEECKKVEGEPPVGDLTNVSVMKEVFSTFNEYQKMFITLLLFEIWSMTVQDCDTLNTPSFSGFINKSDIIPIAGMSQKCFQQLQCCAFLGKDDFISSTYPKAGDFIIIQIIIKNDNMQINQNEHGIDQRGNRFQQKPIIFNAFGYITDNARVTKINHNRDPYIHEVMASNSLFSSPVSKKNDKMPDSCVYFTLMIRPRDKKITGKCNFRIKVVRGINKDLRYFDAIARVPFSPLSHAILDPVQYSFVSPSITNQKLLWKASLNDSQVAAVLKSAEAVRSKRPTISLIHGPPGTGKTSVIISLLLQVLFSQRKEKSRKAQRPKILLCAPSNTAVDEVVLRLLDVRKTLPSDMKFKLVRHGRKKAMHPIVADISTESLAERELISNCDPESIHTELSVLRAEERAISMTLEVEKLKGSQKSKHTERYLYIQKQIVGLEQIMKNGITTADNKVDINSYQLRRQLRDMELKVLQCADIIATTLSSSFTHQMNEAFKDDKTNKKFSCCIIDEATQATEPECLIPLLLSIDNLIMVGDPHQLPAIVLSQTSKNMGLGKSLFARLYNNWLKKPGSTVYKLDTQYRMHPEIAKWPTSYFYSNSFSSAPGLDIDRNTVLSPYTILRHKLQQDPLGESNTGESKLVCNLVKAIQTNETLRELSIGVIVPYQKQKSLILNSICLMKLERAHLITVQTIDSYQGQEKDVVVLSCVRTEGLGFLADHQRLNVALTRAKSSLIIIGNFNSLQTSDLWQALLVDAKNRSKIIKLKQQYSEGMDLLSLVMKKTT